MKDLGVMGGYLVADDTGRTLSFHESEFKARVVAKNLHAKTGKRYYVWPKMGLPKNKRSDPLDV